MKDKLRHMLRQLTANRILALLFVLFIVCVGLAALPRTMEKTLETVKSGSVKLMEYISSVDTIYKTMLDTRMNQPALQNEATYVNLNGWMANLMGQRYMNDVIKMNDGSLTRSYEEVPIEKLNNAVKRVTRYSKALTKQDKKLLFVLAPSKVQKYNEQLPVGFADTENAQADYLIAGLRENEVNVLDLRDAMYEQGLDVAESYYLTDHHWRETTGLWAYREILKEMTKLNMIPEIDPLYTEAENFDFILYKDWFLGSNGRRTGIYFGGVDDFYAIQPRFETNIHFVVEDMDIDKTGRLEDISLNFSKLQNKDYFNTSPYSFYNTGEQYFKHWTNEDAPVDLTLLVHGDSFSNVPVSFFPLCFTNVNDQDMRNFDGDYSELYQSVDPDIVIIMVYTGGLDQKATTYNYFPAE